MSMMEDWVASVCEALKLPDQNATRGAEGSVVDAVLDLTKDVAHGVARPAAPVTAFLVGLAAGRAGGDPTAVREATEKVAAMAREWAGPADEPAS